MFSLVKRIFLSLSFLICNLSFRKPRTTFRSVNRIMPPAFSKNFESCFSLLTMFRTLWRAHTQTAIYKDQRCRPCSPNRCSIGFDLSSIWGQIIRGRWSYQTDVFIYFLNNRLPFIRWTTHIFSFDESYYTPFILCFRFFNPQNLKNSFPKMAVSVAVNEWINQRIWKH